MGNLQLSLDTSATLPTVALLRDAECLHEWIGSKEEHHSSSLLRGIDECLSKANVQAKDLTFLSVGIGPGMFTGLRVGIATAKFFADLYSLPIAPVSSLLALALNAERENASRIWALNDAKSQRVYALCVEKNNLSPSLPAKSEEELAYTPQEASIKMQSGDLLLGEGAEVFAKEWPAFIQLASAEKHIIRASQIGRVGFALFQQKKLVSATDLQPRYLKTGQAHL